MQIYQKDESVVEPSLTYRDNVVVDNRRYTLGWNIFNAKLDYNTNMYRLIH